MQFLEKVTSQGGGQMRYLRGGDQDRSRRCYFKRKQADDDGFGEESLKGPSSQIRLVILDTCWFGH